MRGEQPFDMVSDEDLLASNFDRSSKNIFMLEDDGTHSNKQLYSLLALEV